MYTAHHSNITNPISSSRFSVCVSSNKNEIKPFFFSLLRYGFIILVKPKKLFFLQHLRQNRQIMIYRIFLTAAALDPYRPRKTLFPNSGNPTKVCLWMRIGRQPRVAFRISVWHKCFLSVIETCAWLSSEVTPGELAAGWETWARGKKFRWNKEKNWFIKSLQIQPKGLWWVWNDLGVWWTYSLLRKYLNTPTERTRGRLES